MKGTKTWKLPNDLYYILDILVTSDANFVITDIKPKRTGKT